jgi:tetratricopeptide (TPR) repeat protein
MRILSGALSCAVGLFLLTIADAATVHAQAHIIDSIKIPSLGEWPSIDESGVGAADDQTSADKLTSARKLMRDRRYEPAAALLEIVLEEDPANEVVANLLKTCYLEIGEKGKAEVLVRRQLAGNRGNISNRILLAELLADRVKVEESMSHYRLAIDAIKPGGPRKLQMLVGSMLDHALYDSCRAIISQFRKEFRDSLLFRLDEGMCLERQRQYRLAAETYLPLLAGDTTIEAAEAERRLQQLLSYGESAVEVEGLIVAKMNYFEGSLPYVLMNHLIISGRFDEALTLAIRQDSADPMHGQVLQRHVRLCVDKKAYSEALRGAGVFLSRHVGSYLVGEVQFSMAAAFRGLQKYQQADSIYRVIIAAKKAPRDTPEAWYQLGLMQLDETKRPNEALVSFDSATATSRGGYHPGGMRARPFALAQSGKFSQARDEWTRLTDTTRGMLDREDFIEEGLYHLALLDLFEGNIDSAKSAMRRFMIDYPRGFYTNDAITHLVVFTDADSSTSLLSIYVAAEKERFLHHPDSAVALLQSLSTNENQILAPLALFRLAEVALSRADTSRAVGYLGRLKTEFPQSHYLPYGLKIEADLLLGDSERMTETIRIYRHILKEFPFFPYNAKIRESLRKLEGGSLVG